MTHVDLAWLKDSTEYSEHMESVVVRMLDLMDTVPSFTYVIEQIAHYRRLAERRPDLIRRLKARVQEGRVELAGGMASTLDTNGPNGECFVRNHLLGRSWAEKHLGATVQIGNLIDTFGISAQVPQILQQCGIRYLIANRLGGVSKDEIFIARGLDGSEVLVLGPDGHAPATKRGRIFWRMVRQHRAIDELFKEASGSTANGPHLVFVYDENEHVPSIRSLDRISRYNSDGNGKWAYGTLREFTRELESCNETWRVEDSDLNPVFTGTYGLRPIIRMRNRTAENALLEAEKWAVLSGLKGWRAEIENAWWILAYVQSHDVYTGSLPTKVWRETMEWLDEVDEVGASLSKRALGCRPSLVGQEHAANSVDVRVFNGLPWERNDLCRLELPHGWHGIERVVSGNEELPFFVNSNEVRVLAKTPSVGSCKMVLERGEELIQHHETEVEQCCIENEYIHVSLSATGGIERMLWKNTSEVFSEQCGALLTVQPDDGSFQIEAPTSAELPAAVGTLRLYKPTISEIGQEVIMTGTFPTLPWAGEGNKLEWRLTLFLQRGKPKVDLKVELDWVGEASRIRLHLPTKIDSSTGIFEVPFGTVKRKPYNVRHTCVAQWPAHRFVAVEDRVGGVGLVNRGTVGAEVSVGCIMTTLLRAPATVRTAMIPDDTSSQHGKHVFDFSLVPYRGSLAESSLIEIAQELNTPLTVGFGTPNSSLPDGESLVLLEPRTCVLSAVKAPEDDAEDEIIVRIYEATGSDTSASLYLRGMRHAWLSDILESRLEPIACERESVLLFLRAHEIVTLRVHRNAGRA